MTDSSKNPPTSGRNAPKQPARKPEAPEQPAPVTQRRLNTKHQSERVRQLTIVAITGAAIGLALISVLVGVLYDQVWVPSRPVAQVSTTVLARGDYWRERRLAFAREVSQNFQLLALFGGNQQFSGQFQNRSPVINQQLETIRNSPVDDGVVTEWQNRQLKLQGANALGLSAKTRSISR